MPLTQYSPGTALQDMKLIADGGGHSWATGIQAKTVTNAYDAAPLRWSLNFVDMVTTGAGDAVSLPPAYGGQLLYVFNRTTYDVTIYAAPFTTDTISVGGSLVSSETLSAGTSQLFLSSKGQWQEIAAGSTTGVAGVASFNGRQGTVTLNATDVISAGGAPLASPVFTGTPASPTPTPGDNSTRVSTTAFVQNAIAPLATTAAVAATYVPLAGANNIGNLGVGTTVPATQTSAAVAATFVVSSPGGGLNLSANLFYDGTNWRAISAGTGALVSPQASGSFYCYSTPSAAAGAVVTPRNTFYASAAGGLASFPNSGEAITINATAPANARILYYGESRTWSAGNINGVSNFRIADETGALVALDIAAGSGGAASFVQGRVVSSNSASNPSFTCYDTANGAMGIFCGSGTLLYFANMNAGGGFTGTVGNISNVGNMGINGTLTQGSDASLKEHIEPAWDVGLDAVLALEPKRYNRKGQERVEVGFVAQDVAAVLPEAVSDIPQGIDDDGTVRPSILGLDMMPLLAALVGSVKQLTARLAAAEATIADMRS